MLKNITSKAVLLVPIATTGAVALQWLTVNNGQVTVGTGDVDTIATANNNFVTSAFEITKFIPTIAALAAWFFILNKVMSMIPKGWSR